MTTDTLDDYLYWLERQASKYTKASVELRAEWDYGRADLAAAHAAAYTQAAGRLRHHVIGRPEFPAAA